MGALLHRCGDGCCPSVCPHSTVWGPVATTKCQHLIHSRQHPYGPRLGVVGMAGPLPQVKSGAGLGPRLTTEPCTLHRLLPDIPWTCRVYAPGARTGLF